MKSNIGCSKLIIFIIGFIIIFLLLACAKRTYEFENPPYEPIVYQISAPIKEGPIISKIQDVAIEEGVCWKTMIAIAKKESGLNPNAIGDKGTSYGLFQIHLPAHPTVTIEQATNVEWSARWTAKRLKQYGIESNWLYAVACHNGCGNWWYAESVKNITKTL